MTFQLIHRGKGRVVSHETPAFIDASVAIPRVHQRRQIGNYAMRNTIKVTEHTIASAHTNYKPGKLIDLGLDQCRFIITDENYTMCGAKVLNGKSMCADHHARCFEPGRGRTK